MTPTACLIAPVLALGALCIPAVQAAAANSSPVLDRTVALKLDPIDENVANANNSGTLISDIIANATRPPITDVDAGDSKGFAVIQVSTGGLVSQWQYSLNNGGTWANLNLAQNRCRLFKADANTRLRLIPTANTSGTATLRVRAWDGTEGINGMLLPTTRADNTSSLSANTSSISETVVHVPQPPTIVGSLLDTTVDEDSTVGSTELYLQDSDSDVSTATLTGSSSDQSIIANSGIVLTETGANTDNPRAFLMTLNLVPNAFGTTTITLTATNLGLSSSRSFKVTVNPVDDAPLITGTATPTTIDEDTSLTMTGLSATDPDGNSSGELTLTATFNNGTGHLAGSTEFVAAQEFTGTISEVQAALASISYQPTPDFNGSTTIDLTVDDGSTTPSNKSIAITVNPVLDDITFRSATYEGTENKNLISFFDIDNPDSDTLTYKVLTDPKHGSVTLDDAGNFTYIPDQYFFGTDTFSVRVTTSDGTTMDGTMTLKIAEVAGTPTATDDEVKGTEDKTLVISNATLLANDTNGSGPGQGSPLKITSIDKGSDFPGTLTLGASSITFVPEANFNGTASFSYSAQTDASVAVTANVTITVAAVNDVPVAKSENYSTDEDTPLTITVASLLSNDSDGDGDTITVYSVKGSSGFPGKITRDSNGDYLFTPNANFNGSTTFTYTIKDSNGASATATDTIKVKSVIDAPIAKNDSFTTTEDVPLTIPGSSLLANDTDPDGGALTITAVHKASDFTGTVVLGSNGSVVVTPKANWNGTTTFTYTIQDPDRSRATATVTVVVKAVNDAPVVTEKALTAISGTSTTLALAATDVEGDSYKLSIKTKPAHGIASLVFTEGKWVLTYTSVKGYVGTDTLTYVARDRDEGVPATITITVKANKAPQVVSVTPQRGAVTVGKTINLKEVAFDPENALASIGLVISKSAESADPTDGVSLLYNPADRTFKLLSGTRWIGPFAVGDTAENTAATVTLGGVNVARDGSIGLTWRVTPKARFVGEQTVWGRADDIGGLTDGPKVLGSLTVTAAPATTKSADAPSASAS